MRLPGRARPRRGDPQYAVWEFTRDVDVSRFSQTSWFIGVMAAAVGAAWVAAQAGVTVGLAIVAAGALALAAAAILLEQRRWHAQDVLYWYQAVRIAEWVRDTGAMGAPYDDVAGNEIWLGAHQPGTVPQVYRAHAAQATGDPAVMAREFAALPDATPLDRANREWVQAGAWDRASTRDLTALRAAVAALPDGHDRTMFEAYLAHVEALTGHRAGRRDWLAPLVAVRAGFPRPRLGPWRTFRIVLSRFFPAVWFAVFGTIFVLTLAPMWGPTIPPSYTKTELYTTGDLPKEPDDWNQIWLALPAVADALPAARRDGAQLDDERTFTLINSGLPALRWDVQAINLAPPDDAPGRHVARLEMLLGASSAQHGWVIVTFDASGGPSYLYDLSPGAIRALQELVGVTPADG